LLRKTYLRDRSESSGVIFVVDFGGSNANLLGPVPPKQSEQWQRWFEVDRKGRSYYSECNKHLKGAT